MLISQAVLSLVVVEYIYVNNMFINQHRNCILPNDKSRNAFLEKGGVYTLLDFLQTAPPSLYNILLGLLTELAEYPHTTKHMAHWSGTNDEDLVRLLVQLWEVECKRLGCLTYIKDPQRTPYPLMVCCPLPFSLNTGCGIILILSQSMSW